MMRDWQPRERKPDDSAAADAFARQLAPLTARLRDEGIEPATDLWPGLERALATAGRPDAARDRRRSHRRFATHPVGGAPWALAALAAAVVVAVGLGVIRLRPQDTAPVAGAPATAPVAATPAVADDGAVGAREGLRTVAAALDDLQAALARSPNDPDLSRLVLMIHHSRGRLLRLQAADGVRDARRGPA